MSLSQLLAAFILATTLVASEVRALEGGQKSSNNSRDKEIAERFAPIFFQALGDKSRSDYITNFDFDGDWRGDNNWENLDRDFPLKAYVYYSVAETATHFFIHYSVFHPRDYKGGEVRGTVLSELIREGVKLGGKYDPTGLALEATLAHENDLEGALVVVKKKDSKVSSGQVAFVETLHHNNFSLNVVGDAQPGYTTVRVDDQRALLYVEPKGHGIEAYVGDAKQTAQKDFLRYVFKGHAAEPSGDSTCRNLETATCKNYVSYDLIPLSVLWDKAKGAPNETYGVDYDYGEVRLNTSVSGSSGRTQIKVGKMGCAFLGKVGGENMARPPWGWFDRSSKDPLGASWFFDPATTVKRDFGLDDSFSTVFVRLPFWAR